MPLRFAVLADTHVQPDDVDPGDFPANREFAARNRHAVDLIGGLDVDLVVHLGDVVHPVPGRPGHEPANVVAAEAYGALDVPLFVVPGNHDVGDKPYPFVDAPTAAERHYRRFVGRWGPPFQGFSRAGIRFLLLDTPALGTDLPHAAQQRRWLERQLAAAEESGERVLLFGHYPPYLWEPDEPEHYDNLAPGPRRWLLDLLRRHRVEAVFSGHVHRFFHTRYAGTDLYVVPSVAFHRPGYAELAPLPPGDGTGRDDRGRLGFVVVEVDDEGHRIRPVRTDGGRRPPDRPVSLRDAVEGRWANPLGVTLRHGWTLPVDIATGGLDEFVRKRARDDAVVAALWEGRFRRVRVPGDDLRRPDGRRRIVELAPSGIAFTVFGADLVDLPAAVGVERWELVVAPGRHPDLPAGAPVVAGPVVPVGGSWQGDHFVAHGVAPGVAPEEADLPPGVDGPVVRIPVEAAPFEGVAAAAEATPGAVVIVELPRNGEGRPFDDAAAVANRVVEACLAASGRPEVTVFLDGFVDHDRGYFPRRGLLDRRGDAHPAFHALVGFLARTGGGGRWRRAGGGEGVREFSDGKWRVVLVGATGVTVTLADEPAVVLATGERVPAGKPLPRGPLLLDVL